MLATEQTTSPAPDAAPRSPLLENWPETELMRHVPTPKWLEEKLDHDLRKRIDKLYFVYSDLSASDPRHVPLEAAFRSLCRSLERVSEVARRIRGNPHPPNDLGQRITALLNHALANLNALDPETFGRRLPFQTFERSNAEPLWAAMLSVIDRVHRLTELIRDVDPEIDERLYSDMVQLNPPLRRDPIAL